MSTVIRIFELTECDWVAAESKEQALTFYNQFCNGAAHFTDCRELSPDEMRQLNHHGGISFQDELILKNAEGTAPPYIFCCKFEF